MNFLERSYSGQKFRPKPFIKIDASHSQIVIATSWGASDVAEKAADFILEQLGFLAEPERTSPHQYIEGLTPSGNRLKIAVQMINEKLTNIENRNEYQVGLELVALTLDQGTLSWVHIGSPHILLSSKKGLQPLAYSPDWAWQIHQDSPLLCNSLGVERSVHVDLGSYDIKKDQSLVLVSRSYIPGSFYSASEPELSQLSQILVEDSPETPFWLGVLHF